MTDIAPAPRLPERPGTAYERTLDTTNPQRQGMTRFYEGITSDTDVSSDFVKGYMQGVETPAGRPNHNMNVYEKSAEETMKERAHVGSASWVEAPQMLGEFAQGAFVDYTAPEFQQVLRNGSRQMRGNPAVVSD